MHSLQKNWTWQRRALTIGPAISALLAWMRRLAVLILVALTFASPSAHAAAPIVVPRDFPTIQAAVDAAAPGATISIQPGTYTFYCSIPGHREAGMVGTLIVEP